MPEDAAGAGELAGKKGLVIGIANDQSLAWGCARAFREAGAELAVTYLDAAAEPHVRPLAEALHAAVIAPCDVTDETQMADLFAQIEETWGRLDFVLHAVAFAPKADRHARVVDCSTEGFLTAMNVSCHSFIRLARRSEPLMRNGGCLLTMTFFGSDRVVDQYNLMGPVKGALESTMRYLAVELAPAGIRVHALSPGPVRTRAASGLPDFDELMDAARDATPAHRLVGLEDVGGVAAFLASDRAARLTSNIEYVDAGLHIAF